MFDYIKIVRPPVLSDQLRGIKLGTVFQIKSRSMLFSVINEFNFQVNPPTLKLIPQLVYESPLYKALDEV